MGMGTDDSLITFGREKEPLLPVSSPLKGEIPSIHACLCAYAEDLEELENCMTTFKGAPAWCPVRLSIMLDGHSVIADELISNDEDGKTERAAKAESKRNDLTWKALSEVLGINEKSLQIYEEGKDTAFEGIVYSGQGDSVPYDLYVKASVLPRGKRQSHRVFFKILENNIQNGSITKPTAIFITDADTGSRKGLSEVGRMMDLLMANPGVAALSTSLRVGNFNQSLIPNPIVATQAWDYSCIKYVFGGQSFFRSTQACIGCAVMYNYALLLQKPESGDLSVLEKYTKPFSENFYELVMLDLVEDQGMSVFCLEAGLGTMFSHSTNFYAYVPDSIVEFFGQRRRWMEGGLIGPLHFFFQSTSFFSLRFWRLPYWFAAAWMQLYVYAFLPSFIVFTTCMMLGTRWPGSFTPEFLLNPCRPNMLLPVEYHANLPCVCSEAYTTYLTTGGEFAAPFTGSVCDADKSLLREANGYTIPFYGMWTFMLSFAIHGMDTTPKDWKWLPYYVYVTAAFSLFCWQSVLIMVVQLDMYNPYDKDYKSPYGVTGPTRDSILFFGYQIGSTANPLVSWAMTFAPMLCMFFVLHEPCYWYEVSVGFFSSLMTGAIGGSGVTDMLGIPTMQNPLVMLYTMANLDSTNWGTRATADHGLYGGEETIDTSQYKVDLWWTKVYLLSGWLVLNMITSFLLVHSFALFGFSLMVVIMLYLFYPMMSYLACIFFGRWLDWLAGRLTLLYVESARAEEQDSFLTSVLRCLLSPRIMSCALPFANYKFEGTYCDTAAFKTAS